MKETTPGQPSPKKGLKSLKARVKKHLSDKNDVITDDDIKNINVKAETDVEDDMEKAEELKNAIEAPKQTSPWAILSEEDK
jgi:hypothetical protein